VAAGSLPGVSVDARSSGSRPKAGFGELRRCPSSPLLVCGTVAW
jgi:hypothetical protein